MRGGGIGRHRPSPLGGGGGAANLTDLTEVNVHRVFLFITYTNSEVEVVEVSGHYLCFGKALENFISKIIRSFEKQVVSKVDYLIFALDKRVFRVFIYR